MSESGTSLMLREGTVRSHEQAETSAFVVRLSRGVLAMDEYVAFVARMYFVYFEMERVVSARLSCASLQAVNFPQLRRAALLRQDLEALLNLDGALDSRQMREAATQVLRATWDASPMARGYVNRLRRLGAKPDTSFLVVAHCYVRYLGDLSGGQLLKGAVARSLDLPASATVGRGLSFYTFSRLSMNIPSFKNLYRSRLDALPLTDRQRVELVDEANVAFALNQALFDEIEVPAKRSKL